MQPILAKAAIYVVNVTSIKIAKIRKFASNSVAVFVIVLMLARNSAVDQMLCAFQVIIVQHVFVVMDLQAIQMTLILDAKELGKIKFDNLICAIHMLIVQMVTFAL